MNSMRPSGVKLLCDDSVVSHHFLHTPSADSESLSLESIAMIKPHSVEPVTRPTQTFPVSMQPQTLPVAMQTRSKNLPVTKLTQTLPVMMLIQNPPEMVPPHI